MSTKNTTNNATVATQAVTPRPNYRIYDRTGGGVTEDIYAETLEEAIERGKDWIEEGDWSGIGRPDSEDGETYETHDLECEVGELTYRAPRPELDRTESSRVRDLLALDCAPESISGVDYDDMDRDQLEALADYLDAEDGSVCEEDQEFDSSIAAQIREALEGDDEEVESDDIHDCSGTYTPEMPDCETIEMEISDRDKGREDEQGHDWRSPYSVVGGIKENPGYWSNGGTRTSSLSVCRLCGCYKHESDAGCQRNPNEALSSITIKDRDEKSEAWLKETHKEDGFIPAWLAEMLDCSVSLRMTKAEATEYVESHDDDDVLDDDDLAHAFAAIFHRRARDKDREEGLWSHLNAAV